MLSGQYLGRLTSVGIEKQSWTRFIQEDNLNMMLPAESGKKGKSGRGTFHSPKAS